MHGVWIRNGRSPRDGHSEVPLIISRFGSGNQTVGFVISHFLQFHANRVLTKGEEKNNNRLLYTRVVISDRRWQKRINYCQSMRLILNFAYFVPHYSHSVYYSTPTGTLYPIRDCMMITPAPRQWVDPEMNNAIEQSTVPGSWMRLLGTDLP